MSNEEWRLGFDYLLSRAALVIINPGFLSKSLEWELLRCIEKALDKTIILTWYELDYEAVRAAVGSRFPHGLPELADPIYLGALHNFRSLRLQEFMLAAGLLIMPARLLARYGHLTNGVISFDRYGHGSHTILSAMSTPLALVTGRTARDYRRRFRTFLRERGLEPRETVLDRVATFVQDDLAKPFAWSWIKSSVVLAAGYGALWTWKAFVLHGRCQIYYDMGGQSVCRWWIPPWFGA